MKQSIDLILINLFCNIYWDHQGDVESLKINKLKLIN